MKMAENGLVQYGRRRIQYQVVRRSRRKTVTIAVDPARGVVLYAPRQAKKEKLSRIVLRKAPWIVRKLAQIQEVAQPVSAREFVSGESFLYLGRHYRLRVVKVGAKEEQSVKAWRGRFLVSVDRNLSEKAQARKTRDLLMEWYRAHAQERLPERAEKYAKKSGVPAPKIWIRSQQKRWGSCDAKGNLRFNWYIIMAPMSLVDYVVAHELCHLKNSNHSEGFWKAIRILMPDFGLRRERLRREGIQYLL